MSDFDREARPARVADYAGAAMPQDRDAEASVLAAMLLSEDVLQDALVQLNEGDFYIPSNRKIFSAMRALFDNTWLHLFALDEFGRMAWRYAGDLGWEAVTDAERSVRAVGAST